jgi:large subunit ribosomal protein L25
VPEIALPLDVGRPAGSRPSGRLRADGKIPGVVYGHGLSPVSVAVEGRALRNALNTDAGLNALLTVKIEGNDHLVMARDVQRDPVRHKVLHVDFVIVRRDEVMTVDVPISLIGEAEAIHREDGLVAQELFALTLQAIPANIPNVIEVDISELTVGEAIRVSDLRLPSGVTTELDPETPVVLGTAQAAALVEGAPEGEEGEAAAEGAEGEADAGSAEASGSSDSDSSEG